MEYELYRVRKRFGWDGWEYAPVACTQDCVSECHSNDELGCTKVAGKGCVCSESICRCACGVPERIWGGDTWAVIAGDQNTNKLSLLARRFATGDASLPSADEWLKDDHNARVLLEPARK